MTKPEEQEVRPPVGEFHGGPGHHGGHGHGGFPHFGHGEVNNLLPWIVAPYIWNATQPYYPYPYPYQYPYQYPYPYPPYQTYPYPPSPYYPPYPPDYPGIYTT